MKTTIGNMGDGALTKHSFDTHSSYFRSPIMTHSTKTPGGSYGRTTWTHHTVNESIPKGAIAVGVGAAAAGAAYKHRGAIKTGAQHVAHAKIFHKTRTAHTM